MSMSMKLNIETLGKSTSLLIDVEDSAIYTIGDLKKILLEDHCFEVKRIIFNGNQLKDDNATLDSCKIVDGSSLIIMPKYIPKKHPPVISSIDKTEPLSALEENDETDLEDDDEYEGDDDDDDDDDESSDLSEPEPTYFYSSDVVNTAIKRSPLLIVHILNVLSHQDPFTLSFIATNKAHIIDLIKNKPLRFSRSNEELHALIELALSDTSDSKEETVQEDSKDNNGQTVDVETAQIIADQVESIMQITGLPEERRELVRNMLLLLDRDVSRVVTMLTHT